MKHNRKHYSILPTVLAATIAFSIPATTMADAYSKYAKASSRAAAWNTFADSLNESMDKWAEQQTYRNQREREYRQQIELEELRHRHDLELMRYREEIRSRDYTE